MRRALLSAVILVCLCMIAVAVKRHGVKAPGAFVPSGFTRTYACSSVIEYRPEAGSYCT